MGRLDEIKAALDATMEWDTDAAVSDLRWVVGEIEQLQAIVNKLEKTKDGVPVCESDMVWHPKYENPWLVRKIASLSSFGVGDCFSTHEAKEAAKGE